MFAFAAAADGVTLLVARPWFFESLTLEAVALGVAVVLGFSPLCSGPGLASLEGGMVGVGIGLSLLVGGCFAVK